jgi:hypothetical protein
MTEIWEIPEITEDIKKNPYTDGNAVFIFMILLMLSFFAGMCFTVIVLGIIP